MDQHELQIRKNELMRDASYTNKDHPDHMTTVETVSYLTEQIEKLSKEATDRPKAASGDSLLRGGAPNQHGMALREKGVVAHKADSSSFLAEEDKYKAQELKDSIFNNPEDPLYSAYRDGKHPLHAKAVKEVSTLNQIIIGENNKAIPVNARECVFDTDSAYKGPKK